jgi:hypothetical protein
MKRKSFAILLIVLSMIAHITSVSLCVFSIKPYSKKHGIPAYAITTEVAVDPTAHYVVKTDLHPWNISLVFIILSIPVFLSGYLWGGPHGNSSGTDEPENKGRNE